MKILFCSDVPLVPTLGAPRVLIDLAGVMRMLGWTCDLIGPDDVLRSGEGGETDFAGRLAGLLRRRARDYDVVDYGHEYLPYPRNTFPPEPLFVARSVLLVHHFERVAIPLPKQLRRRIGALVRGRSQRRNLNAHLAAANRTLAEADLVNVPNARDHDELVRRGVDEAKIRVVSFGITRARLSAMRAVAGASCGVARPVVAFVGTFDYRKGAAEFPALVGRVSSAVPDVQFHLMGTGGMFSTAGEVSAFFPRRLRPRVRVTPRFEPNQLPALLGECDVGVFPSHVEGFGFGVLEMLAAGMPVIAYDAPGPSEMLPPSCLVEPGDAVGMADKVIALLRNPLALQAARSWAVRRAADFTWEAAARKTDEVYRAAIAERFGC